MSNICKEFNILSVDEVSPWLDRRFRPNKMVMELKNLLATHRLFSKGSSKSGTSITLTFRLMNLKTKRTITKFYEFSLKPIDDERKSLL